MKRIILILVIVITCCTALAISANAASPAIEVSSAVGTAGDTVEMSIALENNPGIIAMRLDLNYNRETLTLTNVTDTGKLSGQTHSSDYSAYPYTLYWENGTSDEDIVVNDTIVTLTFKIAENAEPSSYPVTVSYNLDNYDIFNYSLIPVRFDVKDGSITVEKQGISKHSISVADVNIGNKISFKANLTTPDVYENHLVVALYKNDCELVGQKVYNAQASVPVSMDVEDAEYAKIMWWNMANLRPYGQPVVIDIK